jgi:molybdopterin/thiamine biosynthesis adenylyltransferase
MLTVDELERYDRQIMLREIGNEGQEKLKKARVFIAGAGGLGSPIAIYLTAAGIGNIRIVDSDKVELSNLNRQVLHWDEDRGRSKADSASEKLQRLNPDVEIEAIQETLTEENLGSLLAGYDLIVDALDNLPTRYLLNKTALERTIPFFHGAIYGFEGRAMTIIPPKTACLRCVYRGLPPEETFPVIGTTPAVIGCIQATEVIKYILGIGTLLTNKLLNYDALDMEFTEFKVTKDPHCEHCGQVKGKN